jgi:sphingomyelin phosphodiesterase 2
MSELSVLTLNIWGLWRVSKKREERVRLIAQYLRSCTEDVVLLQEVWVDADAQTLIRAGKAAGLTHCTHFRSGIFGAGLVTLSRHPIIRHQFWRYAAAGFASSIGCGDYYAGKGVGWVRLSTPLGEVDVFNTHLHANYCHYYREPTPELARSAAAAAAALIGDSIAAAGDGSSGKDGEGPVWHGSRIADDDDAGTRIAQLLELTELITIISDSGSNSISSSSGSSRHVILGGDLNCKPDTLEVDLLRLRLPNLSDAWESSAHRTSSSSNNNNQQQQQQGAAGAEQNPEGYTCHAPGNSFQPRRQVPERIDYIWSDMTCSAAAVTLQMSPAGMSYSDHFAVRATLLPRTSAAAATAPASKAMKLGRAAAAETTKPSEQHKPQGLGEGASMPAQRQVATALAAAMLLEEGMQSFTGSSYTLSALGGFMLASVVYAAFALPMLLPDVIFQGLCKVAGLMLGTGIVAVLGIALLLMGQVADKSQKRALQNAYRLLKVWMQQAGLEPGPGAAESAS